MIDQKKFFEAIVNYNDKIIFKMIQEDPETLNTICQIYTPKETVLSDAYCCSPLSFLVKRGNFVDSEKFIELGASVDGVVSKKGEDGYFLPSDTYSPLCYAAKYNNWQILELLLSKGAKVDIQWQNKLQAIHFAVKADSISCARILLEHGADVFSETDNGDFPLNLASTIDMQNLLIEFGADIKQQSNVTVNFCKNLKLLKNLVRLGADINLSQNGFTALHSAVCSENLEVVKYLLNNGAITTIKDSDGKLASDYAKSKELKDLFFK